MAFEMVSRIDEIRKNAREPVSIGHTQGHSAFYKSQLSCHFGFELCILYYQQTKPKL